MRQCFLKIFVFIISLALVSLPVHLAYAAATNTKMDAADCQSVSADMQLHAATNTITQTDKSCCCDQCDSFCANNFYPAAMLPPTQSTTSQYQLGLYLAPQLHYLSHLTSPPSRPPLS